MQMLKSLLCIVFVVMLLMSCAASKGDHQAFHRMLNNLVGESENVLTTSPESISDLGKNVRKVYINENKCSFFVVVEKSTRKIIRVGYLSDPDNCYLSTDWFSPW